MPAGERHRAIVVSGEAGLSPEGKPVSDQGGQALDRLLTRRRLLEAGLVSAGAAAVGGGAASAFASGRPPARRAAPAAWRVDPRHFPSADQLKTWHRQLDGLGLRATGTPVHERYIDTLHDRLRRAGVRQVRLESVPFQRWTTGSFKLEITDGASAGPVQTASYIPYTGQTPSSGVTGQLAQFDPADPPAPGSLAGKVGLFDVPLTTLPFSFFTSISYKFYDPRNVFTAPGAVYARPWLGQSLVVDALEQASAAGAIAVVGVLDLPAEAAHGTYYPYDGTIRGVPGIYVDRSVGAQLKQAAASGATARVTVPARTVSTKSRNLLGVIPGRSDELMILHSHTDGPNGIEDNGPDCIVAACRYLARLPRANLPRTILVLLTAGHFIGGKGVEAFVARHKDDLVRQTAAAVTLEHLGATEWNAGANGGPPRLTGEREPGTFFAPENRALVDDSIASLKRAKAAPSAVIRPYVPAPGSPDGNGWPAEGTQLWTQGAIPTTNYITGPTYLLNWGIPTTDKYDAALARREVIAFTELLLHLSSVPRSRLRTLDLR